MARDQHSKDITSFFSRIGSDPATYREFPRPPARVSDLSATVAHSSASRRQIRENGTAMPLPATKDDVSAARVLEFAFTPVLGGTETDAGQPAPRRRPIRVAFASLSGGTGKSTLAVNLAFTYSRRKQHAVIVNCSDDYVLSQYRPARTPSYSGLSFLHTPGPRAGEVITVLDAHQGGPVHDCRVEPAASFLRQAEEQAAIVLFDLPSGRDGCCEGMLLAVDHVIVPLVPDLQSVSSLTSVDAMLCSSGDLRAKPHFLLNRYDDSSRFHREMRSRMEKRIGERLIPIAIHEEKMVQEAMSLGFPVADYLPNSLFAKDLVRLTDWLEAFRPFSRIHVQPYNRSVDIARGVMA